MGERFTALGVTFFNPVGNTFDSLVNNFINVAGITLQNEKTALQTLKTTLISKGIWDLCDAIYPFIGSSATAHKYNFKNPIDSDAAYRLTFANDDATAHTKAGYVGNRTAQRYADTHWFGENDFSSVHLSAYNSTTDAGSSYNVLAASTSGNKLLNLYRYGPSSSTGGNISQNNNPNMALSYANYNTAKTGLLTVSRISLSREDLYDGAISIINSTTVETNNTTVVGQSLYLLAGSSGGAASLWSNSVLSFFCCGKGLSAQNVSDLNDAVSAFQISVR